MRFATILVTCYWTVLVAELIGDKSIYTVASLGTQFKPSRVFLAMAAAFGGKMFIAVSLARVLVGISPRWASILSAAAFFSAAIAIWLRKVGPIERAALEPGSSRKMLVAFSSLFLTEWGDPGQMSTAALAAQFHMPLAAWLGGTLAMLTKGTFALVLGVNLQHRLPHRALRNLAVASCCILGVLALVGPE